MEKPFSIENLKTFYTERLGTISCKKDLEAALQEGRINLELNLDDLVSPERREEILRGNPDSIKILGVNRQVQYGYDDWNKKFTASVKVPAADILKLQEAPVLPSGRLLTLEVVGKEGDNYTQFSGTNLEELKQKSRQFLLKKQWDEWRYSGKAPQEQRLENFNPLGELPPLPKPIKFGSDPETGEPVFAFPAVTVESSYGGNKYSIKYFPSREEAEQAQAKVLEIMERARTEQRKKEERERLLAPARELLQKVKANFDAIGYDYSDYGLSYDERNDISDKLWDAESRIESDTKEALEILQEIDRRITQALDYRERRKLAKEKVDAAINEHYGLCPLCGGALQDGECTNSEHNADRIDFEIDEDGNEVGPAVLSQIVTDQGKIVAQLRVSHGEGGRRYRRYRGDVYVVSGSDIGENAWQGEPFESLKFEDFSKILTPEQVEKRKAQIELARREKERAEARARYQEELEYAKQQVEQGYWRRGKFTKGTHPKTGEEQWELTLKSKGLVVKYVVDRWSRQPTAEDIVYFYSERKTLVDTRGFRLVLVWLENPFPEDQPEEPEPTPMPSQSDVSPETLQTSLEELKKKWGAK
ncbi:MAG: hypothetical protein ACK4NX_01700 [Candidatus Paceibacteria bacterium]